MSPQVAETDGYRGTNEGGMLKTTTLWEDPNTGATDELGLSITPTGRKGMDGVFLYRGLASPYWASDLGPGRVPWRRQFGYEDGRISKSTARKEFGLPVRCVKD